MRLLAWLEPVRTDMRFGLRQFIRTPDFAERRHLVYRSET